MWLYKKILLHKKNVLCRTRQPHVTNDERKRVIPEPRGAEKEIDDTSFKLLRIQLRHFCVTMNQYRTYCKCVTRCIS